MNGLVRDLLDLSTIEAGRFSIEIDRVDAGALVGEAAEHARSLAASKAQRLVTAAAPNQLFVACDRRRVLQVLVNLIDNAIKFSPADSAITLTVDHAGAEVCFAVADAGPGIAKEDAHNVFEPFWRPRNSTAPGTGLGLSIAKTIVDAHHGRIWVESAGAGSTFHFCLPAETRV